MNTDKRIFPYTDFCSPFCSPNFLPLYCRYTTMPRKGKNFVDRMRGPVGECELCGREKPLTEHHLIPRAVHNKSYFKKRFSKEEMKHRRISICRACHSGIHRLIPDEKELARHYHTKELLLADERIAKHVAYVRKKR